MLTKEQNFLSMARAVNKVLEKNKTKWAGAKRFVQAATELSDDLNIIGEVTPKAEIETTGATTDKHTATLNAVKLGVKLAKRASIYAIDKKSTQLHDQLRVSKSSLLHRHDAEIISKLRDIYNHINPIITELEDYTISKADVQLLKQLTDAFEQMEVAPRILITERKTTNDLMPEMLNKIRTILYALDSLINIFDNSPFEAEYFNARKIVDLGSRFEDSEEGTQSEPPAA